MPPSRLEAQTPPHPNVSCYNNELWSTQFPNTLVNAGEYVFIDDTRTIILDVSPKELGGLYIEGTLIFDDMNPRTLSSAYIVVTGTLQIGCGRNLPQIQKARIILADAAMNWGTEASLEFGSAGDVFNACQDRGLVITHGGQLLLYGQDRLVPWCELDVRAPAGATSLDLSANVSGYWKNGDTVAIASTHYDDAQAETAILSTSVGGADKPNLQSGSALAFEHLSFLEDAQPSVSGWSMPMRAEVGLLTRTITIEGELKTGTSADYGHVMLMKHGDGTPWCDVSWTEFKNLGIEGEIGRYPFHFHKLGDPTRGSARAIFENNSIHDCHHRFLAIHNTQNVIISGNVGYNTKGHGFYFEYEGPGSADHPTNVDFTDNLGFGVKKSTIGILQSDRDEPAVFYVEHPNNRISGNHAAGSEGHGFYLDPADSLVYTHTNAGTQSFFKDNVAHTCVQHGFYQNTRPDWNYTGLSTDLPAAEGLDAWKCRRYGVWWRTHGTAQLKRTRIADCRGGLYPATEGLQDAGTGFTGQILIRDLLAIGVAKDHNQTAAPYYPQTSKYFVDPGNTVGHAMPWDVLSGIELYDGHLDIEDARFAQFRESTIDSDVRPAGPFTQVAYDSQYSENPQNRLRDCEFFDVDQSLYYRIMTTLPNMIRNTVVLDEDGSLGGATNTYYAVRTDALVANHTGGGPPSGSAADGWYSLPQAQAPFAQITVVGTAPGSGGVLPTGQDHLRVSVLDYAHSTKTQTVRNTGTSAAVWPFNGILGNVVLGPNNEAHGVYYCSFDTGVSSNKWPSQYRIEIEYATTANQKVIVGVPFAGTVTSVEGEGASLGPIPPVANQNGGPINLEDLILTTVDHAYVQVGTVVYVRTLSGLEAGSTLLPHGTKNYLLIQ